MSDPLRVRLVVNGARSAARAGDLDGAVRLLDELELPDLAVRATPDTSGTPGTSSALDADAAAVVAALDLRARVHAQRGELEEADRCWAAVQEVSPDDQGAEAGRRTIEEIRLGRRRSKPLLHTGWLGVAAAAVAVVALAAGIVVLSPDPAAQGQVAAGTAQPAGPAASRPGSSAEADALREHVAAVEARKAAESERKARQAADRKRELVVIARRLAMPGLIVQRRSQDVRVRFKTGLFPASADIGAAGPPLLRALGRRIAGMQVDTTVVGHAVPVPGGRTRGGSVVALGRALVAARYLAEGGRLPITAFTLVSADQSDNPFRDPRRNRTVTLLIAPRT
ncbi:hypothetical protein [Nonomuraea rubra]|uniref:OmpA-like domain-containing protein n=1 Tax=Nonomuraea rubra TaxID=46180 RepID=A0A7X0P336_9ACTN|nr:hypothetical protein [Nonomuraea rubra]MBB6554390.1 hypothetical protein [Nonomuraea rubra]